MDMFDRLITISKFYTRFHTIHGSWNISRGRKLFCFREELTNGTRLEMRNKFDITSVAIIPERNSSRKIAA